MLYFGLFLNYVCILILSPKTRNRKRNPNSQLIVRKMQLENKENLIIVNNDFFHPCIMPVI